MVMFKMWDIYYNDTMKRHLRWMKHRGYYPLDSTLDYDDIRWYWGQMKVEDLSMKK